MSLYIVGNPKTKKALREMVTSGKTVESYQPGGMFETPTEGWTTAEGPHYPEPHRWYAQVLLEDGKVIKVK